MANQRPFQTKFWNDNWVSSLDPIEKLLYIYLFTNDRVTLCGIYEIPLKVIAVDTGIDRDTVVRLIARFEKDRKVKYENGWMAVLNIVRYHNIQSPKIIEGLKRELKNSPENLRKWVHDIQVADYPLLKDTVWIWYLYGMDRVSYTYTNTYTNTSLSAPRARGGETEKENDGEFHEVAEPEEEKESYAPNVKLKPSEFRRMISDYGEKETKYLIEEMSSFKGKHRKEYDSDYDAIVNRKLKTDKQSQQALQKSGFKKPGNLILPTEKVSGKQTEKKPSPAYEMNGCAEKWETIRAEVIVQTQVDWLGGVDLLGKDGDILMLSALTPDVIYRVDDQYGNVLLPAVQKAGFRDFKIVRE